MLDVGMLDTEMLNDLADCGKDHKNARAPTRSCRFFLNFASPIPLI